MYAVLVIFSTDYQKPKFCVSPDDGQTTGTKAWAENLKSSLNRKYPIHDYKIYKISEVK